MNRVVFLVVGIVMGIASVAYAQEDSVFQSIRSQTILNRLAGGNGIGRPDMISELKLPPKRLVGNTYLNTEWTAAVILLVNKGINGQVLDGVPIKYDVHKNEFDINSPEGVRVLSGKMVRSFAWRDKETGEVQDFENVKNYKQDIYEEGMFRRLTTGSLSLLQMTEVSIKKADYNVAMNVGNTNDVVLKKEKICYVADDGNVTRLPKSQKKIIELFGPLADAMKEYIKSHSLLTSTTRDLQNIFTYYNSLIKPHPIRE